MSDLPRRNTRLDASNLSGEPAPQADDGTLTAVVASCQQGDRAAYESLFNLCHPRVFRLCARLVGPQDAADVTQDVFLQLFRSLGQFSGRSRFGTWLYRLTVNEALQHLRRDRHRRHRTLDWEPVDDSQLLNNAEQREMLQRALQRLDPELRTIFLLREMEELSYDEIAEVLEIPTGTVGSRLNRAARVETLSFRAVKKMHNQIECSQARERLSHYYDNEVAPDVSAAVAAHLARCTHCAEELKQFRALTDIAASWLEVEPPAQLWRQLHIRLNVEQGEKRPD